MSPHPRRRTDTRPGTRRARRRLLVVGLVAALGVVLAACGSTFDPTGACKGDGSAPGAYPELEAAIPKLYKDAKPINLDSGRTCTPTGLGTLAGHGVKELRFAGGTWSTGTDSGLSLAVFTSPDGSALDPAWITEFFETSAKGGKNVTSLETTDYPITTAAAPIGRRIDVLNGESFQSIVVWAKDGKVAAALVGSFIREIQTKEAHDLVVRAAVDDLAR